MITLPNNCRCSEIRVSPLNWNRKGASIAKNWRIHYRFYDPSRIRPVQVTIKSGINRIKNLDERRHLAKQLIENEYKKLKEEGYNPLQKDFVKEPAYHYEIDPQTPSLKL